MRKGIVIVYKLCSQSVNMHVIHVYIYKSDRVCRKLGRAGYGHKVLSYNKVVADSRKVD